MIGKSTLKKYEYKEIEDYFNYIIDSYVNGNFKQVKNLYLKLSESQREDFINYLSDEDNFFNEKINLMGFLLK